MLKIFWMILRFLSETCFLTKIIAFILMIFGSEIHQASTRHFSVLCGNGIEHYCGGSWEQNSFMHVPTPGTLAGNQDDWAELGPSRSPCAV